MIDSDLLDLLACPIHRSAVAPAGDELVRQINRRIDDGQLRNRGGQTVSTRIDGALVCSTDGCLFPVEHDIPSLLVEDALLLQH